MKWKVNDDHLARAVLHVALHILQDNIQVLIGQCSFAIGEIYIYQPLTTWLNLHDSDEV